MIKATRLPSGSWRARVSYTDSNGVRHTESFTRGTKREAEFAAAEFEMRKDYVADSRNWTLGDAIDAYINMKRHALSPTTIQGYEKIRNQNFQSLMDVPLKKITQEMMHQAVLHELSKKPSHRHASTMSVKSVKNAYGLIRSVINRYNPTAVYVIDFPKTPRRIRTLPEPAAVYAAVKDTRMELPVLLAMWLSFTESEIRGLTKSKSIDGEYITIREVLVPVGGIDVRKEMAKEETRNRRHRMPLRIRELIDQVEDDVIVPESPSVLLKGLRRCLRAAGVQEITFHDLRHINASLMATLGIPDVYAQERGGWKTDHIMKTVYTETFTRARQNVDNIIDNYFLESVLS